MFPYLGRKVNISHNVELVLTVKLYVTVTVFSSPYSEETDKGHLAKTKESVFGKCSDGFLCHLSVINFLIIHLLCQL